MLDKIKAKLKELDKKVFYGRAGVKDEDLWDYIVFGRRESKKSGTTMIDRYFVAVVQEEFIEEGFAESVTEQMKSIGLKLVDESHKYDYMRKGSTDQTIEILLLEFSKSKKGC